MIANPDWFQRRKYSGWGATPKTWQGWAYIVIVCLLFVGLQYIPIDGWVKVGLMMVVGVVFSIDIIHIMISLKRDEREIMHEAIAERNAAWFMVLAIAIGLAYRTSQNAVLGITSIDWLLVIPLAGGLFVKAITNFYLGRKA